MKDSYGEIINKGEPAKPLRGFWKGTTGEITELCEPANEVVLKFEENETCTYPANQIQMES